MEKGYNFMKMEKNAMKEIGKMRRGYFFMFIYSKKGKKALIIFSIYIIYISMERGQNFLTLEINTMKEIGKMAKR